MTEWGKGWPKSKDVVIDDLGVAWPELKTPKTEAEFKAYHLIIPMVDGTVRYVDDAIIVGDLAIHKGTGWRITHIPTMSKFDRAVPPGLHTKRALINWCIKVQGYFLEDWSRLRNLTPDNYRTTDDNDEITDEEMNDVKERIKDWCLSVKVEE